VFEEGVQWWADVVCGVGCLTAIAVEQWKRETQRRRGAVSERERVCVRERREPTAG
jgi:hypothetical protein